MLLKLALPTVVVAFLIYSCERERRNGTSRPLTTDELESHLRGDFGLREIKLTELPEGRIEGGGSDSNGRSYRFEISQSSESRIVLVERLVQQLQGVNYKSTYTTRFSDYTHFYLLLCFGYIVWVGRVMRKGGFAG